MVRLLGIIVLLIGYLTKQGYGLSVNDFYNYYNEDSNVLQRGDEKFEFVKLKTPIHLFSEVYEHIYVNTNGILTFGMEFTNFLNIPFPLEYAAIAPFYSNIDTTLTNDSATIVYFQSQNENVLYNASQLVTNSFAESIDFKAENIFVVTWENVGAYQQKNSLQNTFQVAVICSSEETYVQFLYPKNGLNWIQGDIGESGLPDIRAQAGFISEDGRHYTLKGSGTENVKYLSELSNFGVPGLWLFRVGPMGYDSPVEQPDIVNDLEHQALSCVEGGQRKCASNAICTDTRLGFCCSCLEGYYGNGYSCIRNDVPLRVSGAVSGSIGNDNISAQIQSYVVIADGRSYTAVSPISIDVGYQTQLLSTLGEAIGWLFAKPLESAVNGYQLTGGKFNHSTILEFSSGEVFHIKQQFHGLNVYDQLSVDIEVNGNIPNIVDGTKVRLLDVVYQYHSASPQNNVLKQSSVRKFTLSEDESISYNIHETINFDTCPYAETPNVNEQNLLSEKISKVSINYDPNEKALRIGLMNKVGISDKFNPCASANCGENTACFSEDDDTYECVCQPGFILGPSSNEAPYCVDIDECQGEHICDSSARCTNQPGGYSCQCMTGFEGNGYVCTSRDSLSFTLPTIFVPEHTDAHQNNNEPEVHVPVYDPTTHHSTSDDDYELEPDSDNEYLREILQNRSQQEKAREIERERLYNLTQQSEYDREHDRELERERDEQERQRKLEYERLRDYERAQELQREREREEYYRNQEEEHKKMHKPLVGCDQCSEFAECINNKCQCKNGWNGDGFICEYNCPALFNWDGEKCIPYTNSDEEEELQPFCTIQGCTCPTGYELIEYANSQICQIARWETNHNENHTHDEKLAACNVENNCGPDATCEWGDNEYVCFCLPGFEGDGYDCVEVEASCLTEDICDPNASCLYDKVEEKAICHCNLRYEGDGRNCQLGPECINNIDCGQHTICDTGLCLCEDGYERDASDNCVPTESCGGVYCAENAVCKWDYEQYIHYCHCPEGHEGDGISSCKSLPPQCNIRNNCGLYATCSQNYRDPHKFECICTSGYYGDGFVCTPEENCENIPSLCDQHASCISTPSGLTCVCNQGFLGNGSVCTELPKVESGFLLISQGNAIIRLPYDGKRGKPLLMTQMAIGLDKDCATGRFYWSDITLKSIMSAKYDGTDKQQFISEDIGSPEGIAIDWISRRIYWTDSSKDTIEVASLDNPKQRAVIIKKHLVNPRGIAVDPHLNKIYWSDWNRDSPKIEWSNLDGTNREILLSEKQIQLPNSLVINHQTGELCYADAGVFKIECIDTYTKIIRTIASNLSYPFGVSVSDDHFYWTDWSTKKIESIDFNGVRKPALSGPLYGNHKMYGMTATSQKCPISYNLCANNGECPPDRICLNNPSAPSGRSCKCTNLSNCNEIILDN